MQNYYQNENYITGDQAAELLGVSRRTIYRWVEQGRLSAPFTKADIRLRKPKPRQRGPKRNHNSIRYTEGRHNRTGRNWQKASG